MSYKLLIVDDSKSMRSVIKKVLEMSGFVADAYFEAGDGQEALQLLTDIDIDLVLTDINMPVMDGMTFLTELRRDEKLKNLPVIVVSTEGSAERRGEAERLGAAGYLQKPFQPEEIRGLLQEHLGWTYEPEAGDDDDPTSF